MSASYPLPQRPNSRGGSFSPLRFPAEVTTQHSNPELYWLTADLLFHYQRCSRRAYLDLHGPDRAKDPPSDYLLKLRQDSAEHRRTILRTHEPLHRPDYPAGDWMAGAQATEALMQQGVEAIVRPVLVADARVDGVRLTSQPDLLIKQAGWSYWGDWTYAPIDIKLGKKPKLDYQVVAAYHAYILARVQGMWPENSWLALREGRLYAVDLERQLIKLQEVLNNCIADLQHPDPPEVFISHSRCDLCHWFSHCYQEATSVQHLSLLPGVTPARYEFLKERKLTTVEALAQANPQQLTPLPGFGEHVAEKMVHQAQALLGNCAIARTAPHPPHPFPLTPDQLPSAEIELYFDIEAAPDQNLIYLHGVLVVDHGSGKETFHALLAESPETERHAWEQFLDLVHQYPQAPIYHFCPYEAQTVQKLGQYYDTPPQLVDPLLTRFFDVHKAITESVTLPIESYALKHIARWIGFDWRDEGANGAQSICWYNAWLETCDRTYLDAILRYNEDDCRATYHIKSWLAQFAQAYWI